MASHLGREELKQIAEATLETIKHGSYTVNGTRYELTSAVAQSKKNTRFFASNSLLSAWRAMPASGGSSPSAKLSVLEISTLQGARLLSLAPPDSSTSRRVKVGVLNFASARKAGGGFLSGAQAQEESIARSSTLYPTLMTATAQSFYTNHNRDQNGGYYSHAMIYSPGVVVLRDDAGVWTESISVDVVTSPAVNAGVVRERQTDQSEAEVEGRIAQVMRERMGRILFLFEKEGVKRLVLGSFGTGVFKNSVGLVANIWADLLLGSDARFRTSFDEVVFAILGKSTVEEFERVFAAREHGRGAPADIGVPP